MSACMGEVLGCAGSLLAGWEEHLGRGGRGQGGPPQRRVDEGWGAGVSGLQKHLVVRTSALAGQDGVRIRHGRPQLPRRLRIPLDLI